MWWYPYQYYVSLLCLHILIRVDENNRITILPTRSHNDSWEGFGRIQLLQSNLPTTPFPHQLQRKCFEQCKMMYLVVPRKQPLLHGDWLQASTTTFTYVISFYTSNILDTAYYADNISLAETTHGFQKVLNWPGYHHQSQTALTHHITPSSQRAGLGSFIQHEITTGKAAVLLSRQKQDFVNSVKPHFDEKGELFG